MTAMSMQRATLPVHGFPASGWVMPQEPRQAIRLRPDETIFTEGGTAAGLYRVVSGLVRGCRFLADGRRHIDAFYKPGDVFGFAMGGVHGQDAEAVTACTVERLRPQEAGPDQAALYDHALRALAQAQAHGQLLGRASAGQKLAAFLLELLASGQRGVAGEIIELPMNRQDIADYLGLTIETVSRTLAQLERDQVVELTTARRIRVPDRAALRALCG